MNKLLKELKYSFRVIFHPFDGFWCIKSEKKAGVLAATVILLLLAFETTLSKQLTGFAFKKDIYQQMNILSDFLGIAVLFALWVISNWSITTLLDGEGKMKEIYIVSAYAFVPMLLLQIVMILASNILVLEEASFYNLIEAIAYVWSGFLLFSGIMTVHQYTVKKTVLTVIIAIVGMIAIAFLILLFFALIQQLINFIFVFYKEFSLRI